MTAAAHATPTAPDLAAPRCTAPTEEVTQAEPVVVSLRREAGEHAVSVFVKHGGFTLRAGQVVELDPATDADLIEDLRRWPLHDGPGCQFGEDGFRPRHDVVTRGAWDARVEKARSRLTESARIAADSAALAAASREVAKVGDPTDLGLINTKISRRGAR